MAEGNNFMQNADDESRVQSWKARAAFYELLALGFRFPDIELVHSVCEGGFADAAQELALACGLEATAVDLKALRGNCDTDMLGERFKAEYTRLFIGGSEGPLVDPYECIWDAKEKGTKPLLFISPKAFEVEKFFKACGVGQPDGTNEPLDHIATELEFVEYLSALCAGIAAFPEGMSAEGYHCGSPQKAYGQFIADHLSAWASKFADGVICEAREPFYVGVATLLKEFVEYEAHAA